MATASMDFFEHQDRARRMTGRLVMLFAAAVVGIVASTYFLVIGIMFAGNQYVAQHGDGGGTFTPYQGEAVPHAVGLWQPDVLLLVAIATLAVVGFGTLYKVAQLAGGGHVVAEHLGGRRLSPDSTDPLERKILNVVEEMAIASGTPVPPVFLLNAERGINAFAAGFRPEDAVIAVTRGAVEQLSRDQLQGVIAHEFSHVLNGDMRLNIRLIGIINGILVVGLIGYYLMRTTIYMRPSGGNKKGDPRIVLLAMGVGLIVIGFLGTLFGNLIKAAVSRQREFLADASAVQFTRNPEGIGGALKTIAGYKGGSALVNPNAPEASHMFFAAGLTRGIQSMFATHPPLNERIARIDRTWSQERAEHHGLAAASGAPAVAAAYGGAMGFAGVSLAPSPQAQRGEPVPGAGSANVAVQSIGRPTPQHVDYARAVVASIPDDLTAAAREPYGARAVVYAMLLDPADADIRKRQLEALAAGADAGVYEATRKLHAPVADLPRKARLPLIDLAIPALRALSPTQYTRFRDNVDALVNADQKIDLFEWMMRKIVLRHLEPHFTKVAQPRAKFGSLAPGPVADAVATVLSALSYVGAKDADAAAAAFAAGAESAGLPSLAQKPMDRCRLGSLDAALDTLAELTGSARRTLITAAAATIAADDKITTGEAELLRAVADTLACPMPPLL